MPNTRHGEGSFMKPLISDIRNISKDPINLIKDVITKRNDYPPDARQVIKEYGTKLITHIDIGRTPVQKALTESLNILSMGSFNKKLNDTPYDRLFHLYLIVTLEGGK